MNALTTVRYEPAKREALFDLLERVWGERPDPAEFSWWFEQSPVGSALQTVAEEDGRIVGIAAMSYVRARLEGREQIVPVAAQLATDPELRGRGIFSRLERANEEEAARRGAAVALVFPNRASRPILVERLGWAELWRGRIWARPPLPSLSRGSFRIQPLTSIPAEAGQLDDGAANGVIVDAELLAWRYLQSPRTYRVLGAYEDGRLRGLLALRPRRGRIAVVCHALGDVAQLLRTAGSKGAAATIALVPPWQRRAFVRAGFLPSFKSIRVLGKQLRPEGSLAGEWQFQLGDFDVF